MRDEPSRQREQQSRLGKFRTMCLKHRDFSGRKYQEMRVAEEVIVLAKACEG